MTNKNRTRDLIEVGLLAASLAVLAQISIPLPGGVPLTMQTFTVAFIGLSAAFPQGLKAILVYLLLGAIGVPVFAGFKGGLSVLLGPTGGFLGGFILQVLILGLGAEKELRFGEKILLSALAVPAAHLPGLAYFSLVTKRSLVEAFLLASYPFLLKDFCSNLLAFPVAKKARQIKAQLEA